MQHSYKACLPACAARSAVSSPRASCPARQRGLLLSRREGGIYGSMQTGVTTPPPPPPQPSRNPLQRSATGASVSTGSQRQLQRETYSRITDISTSLSQVHKYPNRFLAHRRHPRVNHTLTVMYCMCSYMLSYKQLDIIS